MVWLLEGLLAADFGIIWEEHHGGPFEIHQCSRILSNVNFLELYVRNLEFKQESVEDRAIVSSKAQCQPNYPLPSLPPGIRLRYWGIA